MRCLLVARYAALWSLLACNNPETPELVDAPEDPVEHTVFVELAADTPVFVRYRSGTGPWREPTDIGTGYQLAVADDYQFVAVCATATAFDGAILAATVDDGDQYIACFTPFEGTPAIQISGTMKQPGLVVINGGTASSATPNWSYQLPASIGKKDVVAMDSTRVAIRRDVEVLGDTALPVIDLVAEGASHVATTFTVETLPSERLASTFWWYTANNAAVIPFGDLKTLHLPPASIVDPFDARYVSFDAFSSGNRSRSTFLTLGSGSPTEVSLLPPLEGVTFDGNKVRWTDALPGDVGDLYVSQGTDAIQLTATNRWLAGRHELAVDTAIPGYDPAWNITHPAYRAFWVSDAPSFQYRTSTVEDLSTLR